MSLDKILDYTVYTGSIFTGIVLAIDLLNISTAFIVGGVSLLVLSALSIRVLRVMWGSYTIIRRMRINEK